MQIKLLLYHLTLLFPEPVGERVFRAGGGIGEDIGATALPLN